MPHYESDEAVLVLAAGRGERMGGPKALMEVAGAPWWRTQCEHIAQWKMRALWVVSAQVDAAMADEPQASPRVLADTDAPMFASLVVGFRVLAQQPPSAVYVLPVDVPACAPTTIAALRTAGNLPAIPMHDGEGGHPVRLPWPFVAKEILPAANDGAWVMTARLDHLLKDRSTNVVIDDAAVTANLNTPQAVRAWLARPASE